MQKTSDDARACRRLAVRRRPLAICIALFPLRHLGVFHAARSFDTKREIRSYEQCSLDCRMRHALLRLAQGDDHLRRFLGLDLSSSVCMRSRIAVSRSSILRRGACSSDLRVGWSSRRWFGRRALLLARRNILASLSPRADFQRGSIAFRAGVCWASPRRSPAGWFCCQTIRHWSMAIRLVCASHTGVLFGVGACVVLRRGAARGRAQRAAPRGWVRILGGRNRAERRNGRLAQGLQ